MARRLQLHEKLCEILGTRNVYFQPPESLKLSYDAIVYKVVDRNDIKADDLQYRNLVGYEVIFISKDPDSEVSDQLMSAFRYIKHNQTFPSGNLHHNVFTLYF